jgi:hypothetical protein
MKVVKLQAENFKRLKAIDITPTDPMMIVSGANAQGKTSVLDAIWAALGGGEMSKSTGTVMPIRDGEKSAFVKLDIGDYIVTRKWTASGSTLAVETREGAAYKSPQAILDGLVGKIAFDPLSFANMDEKKQRETLLKLVDLGIDLDKIAADRKAQCDARTDVNKVAKLLSAKIAMAPVVPEDTPDMELSLSAIAEEINAAQAVIRANDKRREAPAKAESERDAAVKRNHDLAVAIDRHNSELEAEIARRMAELEREKSRRLADIERLKASVPVLEKAVSDANDKLEASQVEVAALVDPDTAALNAKMSGAEAVNSNVRVKQALQRLRGDLEEVTKNADAHTAKIEALDAEKEAALKSAKFPVDGLGFSDTGVTFNGIPFSQCSAAERLRTSIAMAMAMNPKLRVLRITDGSLIDSKNMAIIEEMVKSADYQCWLEKVQDVEIATDGSKVYPKTGVYIEEGEVKNNQ